MTERLDRVEQLLVEIAERQLTFQEQLSQTRQTAEDAVQMVLDLGDIVRHQGEQAEQDRSQAAIDRAEFRSTVNQLLERLVERFNTNGHGHE